MVRPLHTKRTSVLAMLAAVAWMSVPAVSASHRDTLPGSTRIGNAMRQLAGDAVATVARKPGPQDPAYAKAAPASAAPHVRIEDSRLKGLLAEGTAGSPTLRRLVDHLDQSDVVVYLKCDQQLRDSVAGRLSFVGASAGRRYVQARVGYLGARVRQIALISHELQHAVEVADAPGITDVASFEREYRRMGFISQAATPHGAAVYETDAAMATGEQVLRELLRGTD